MAFTWHVYVNWNNDGYTYTDEGNRLKSLRLDRGKKGVLERPFVGRATVTLDNYDQRYDSWYTSSALYPNIVPGRRIQIAVQSASGSQYYIFTGRLDSPKVTAIKGGGWRGQRTVMFTAQDGWKWLNEQRSNIALKTNRATGDAIYDVLAAVGWIEGNVWILGTSTLGTSTILGGLGIGENVQIDTGSDTIPFWWTADESARASILDLVGSEWGRAQINGGGTFVFKARQSDYATTVDLQLTDASVAEVQIDVPWEMVKNKVRVTVNPRTLATAAELWRLYDTPSIATGQSITIWAAFQDRNGNRIPSSGVIDPTATTDYTANTASDGSGTDKTANISIATSKFSTTAKLVITNNAAVTVYITFLRLRGQAVEVLDSHEMVAEDATSQSNYTLQELAVDLKWQQSTLIAQDAANWLVAWLKDPLTVPTVVMQSLPASIQYELGTKVEWNSAILGFDNKYRIGEIQYELADGAGQDLRVSWLLLPTGQDNFWILGTSTLGTDTKLGY